LSNDSTGEVSNGVPIPQSHWIANYRNRVNSSLDGVAAISPSDVWAVGNFGIEHYNGQRWQRRTLRGAYLDITAVTPAELWAVGGAKILHRTCK
jgi:hypothetical protein